MLLSLKNSHACKGQQHLHVHVRHLAEPVPWGRATPAVTSSCFSTRIVSATRTGWYPCWLVSATTGRLQGYSTYVYLLVPLTTRKYHALVHTRTILRHVMHSYEFLKFPFRTYYLRIGKKILGFFLLIDMYYIYYTFALY